MDEDENIVDSGSSTSPRVTVEADDGATAKCSVCKKRLGRKSKLLLSGIRINILNEKSMPMCTLKYDVHNIIIPGCCRCCLSL